MNFYTTSVSRQLFFCAALAFLFAFLSIETFAQNQPVVMSYYDFMASLDKKDETRLQRPRVIVTEGIKPAAAAKTTVKTTAPAPRLVGTYTPNSTPRLVVNSSANSASNPTIALASGSAAIASQMEKQAFAIVNSRRAQYGLPPLAWSEDMAKVARGHSMEMAQFRFFSHAGRNGSMVDDRADLMGFSKWKAIGENIAYNQGYDNPAEFACERWMQSVSHRQNILNRRWQEAGIGVAITADGRYYFTEVFAVR